MTHSHPHILIIGGKNSSIDWVEPLGVRADLIQHPEQLTERQKQVCHRVILSRPDDREQMRALVAHCHAEDPYDFMLCFAEAFLRTAAWLCRVEGLRWTNPEAIEIAADKAWTRRVAATAGIEDVRYQECRDQAAAASFADRCGYPIIVKPTLGSGSRGVALVHDPQELATAFRTAQAQYDCPVVLEQFVDGPEFSVETMSRDGMHQMVAITAKRTTGAPHFVELGHVMPAELPEHVAGRIRELVTRVLDSIGHETGPCHTEVRVRADGTPVLIETQCRFGGDQIWEMAQLTTGINFVRETLAHFLGRSLEPLPVTAPAAAIRFLTAEPGRITALHGLEQSRARPGIVRVQCDAQPDQIVRPLRSSRERLGYVLAVGANAAQAMAHAEAAHADIAIETVSAAA